MREALVYGWIPPLGIFSWLREVSWELLREWCFPFVCICCLHNSYVRDVCVLPCCDLFAFAKAWEVIRMPLLRMRFARDHLLNASAVHCVVTLVHLGECWDKWPNVPICYCVVLCLSLCCIALCLAVSRWVTDERAVSARRPALYHAMLWMNE